MTLNFSQSKSYGGCKRTRTNFTFSWVLSPRIQVHVWHFEQVGINATKFGKKQIHFHSCAFEAGTVFVAKAP